LFSSHPAPSCITAPQVIRDGDADVQNEFLEAVQLTKDAVLRRGEVIAVWKERYNRYPKQSQ
jgi:hypothetical protein